MAFPFTGNLFPNTDYNKINLDWILDEMKQDREDIDQNAADIAELKNTVIDYDDLINKPQINSVTLSGDKSLSDIGAASEDEVNDLRSAFIVVESNNIFNKNDPDIEIGKYIDQYAHIVSVPSYPKYIISGYIPVSRNTDYVITQGTNVANKYGSGAYVKVLFYNSEKVYVWQKSGVSDPSNQYYTINTPDADIAYMRVNIYDNLNGFMVVQGTSYPGSYIPYENRKTLAEDITPNDAYTNIINPLYRKTAIFCGDSICEAIYDNGKGWAGFIGNKNNMIWKNYGISGATITKETGHTSILNLSSTMETEYPNADYIIFEGGTNDADVIGSILNGNTPAKFGSYDMTDYSGSYDDTTFCGAVEKLFYRMITVWDKKKIGFIIAHKMGKVNTGYTDATNNRRAYFGTIMTLCEKWGIPFINLWDGCYLNPSIGTCYNSNLSGEENRAQGYPIYDGQHLSTEGYGVVSPMIEAWMKTL